MSANGQYQLACVYSGYLYLSTNHGISWTAVATDATRNWTAAAISANGKYQSAALYSGTNSAGTVYYSSNYGVTWSAASGTTTSPNCQSIAMSSTGQYQVAADYGNGVYVSSDYGATWSVKSSGGNFQGVACSATGKFMLATRIGYSLYYSNDYGNTWNSISTSNAPGGQHAFVAMSSNGKYCSYTTQNNGVGTGYIYRSSDYGSTWTAVATDASRYWQEIKMSADGEYQIAGLFSGTGIYKSLDYGVTWTLESSASTYNNKFYMAISSNAQYVLFATSGDNKLYQSITPYNNLSVNGNMNSYGNLFVAFDTSMNSRLVVGSDATVNKRLFIVGDASFSGNLYVGSSTATSSNSTGALIVNGGVGVNGSIWFPSNGAGLVWGSTASQIMDDGDLKIKTDDTMRFYTDNTERITINSSGYVGINTTTPYGFVDIAGNTLTLAGNSPDNGFYHNLLLSSPKPGNTKYAMALGIDYTSGAGYINAAGNAQMQPVCLNTRGGYVGIGTTSPTQALEVNGTVRLNTGNNSYNKLLVLYDTATGDAVSSATNFYGFGINNGTLRYQTDVTGAQHKFYCGDTLSTSISNTTVTSTNFYATSDITANNRLFTIGDASLNGNLFVAFDTSLNSRLVVGSDITTNKRLFTLGDISTNGNLFVIGDASFTSRLYVGSDVSLNGNLTMNKNFTINKSSGYVGIATSAPTNFLQIAGNTLSLAANSPDSNPAYHNILLTSSKTYTGTPYSMSIGVDSSSGAGYINAGGNNGYQPVCLNTRGGNVAIGTTAPTGKLHIYETTGTSASVSASGVASGTMVLEHGNAGGTSSIIFKSATNANSDYGYIYYMDDILSSSTNERSALFIGAENDYTGSSINDSVILQRNGGYVGICTSTPQQALAVNGTIQVNSANNTHNKLLVLWDGNTNDPVSSATNFYGFGINSNAVRYQVPGTGQSHLFYCGTALTTIIATNISDSTQAMRYFTVGSSQLTATGNITPSSVYMRVYGPIITTGFYAVSDKRIKYNIHDFANISSIEILRYLRPRIFNFIDKIKHGTEPVWGFIAQEVAEIIPNAVTYNEGYIPNIYEVAEIFGKEIKLGSKTTNNLLKDKNAYYPLKLMNTKEEDIIVNITEIIDEKTFKIDQEIETEYNKVFVYGQEVPDFHSLDKDQIFTITTAAVKEIDKELQETKNRVKLLEEENQILKQQISEILERLSKANL